jgi:hypothetical protein
MQIRARYLLSPLISLGVLVAERPTRSALLVDAFSLQLCGSVYYIFGLLPSTLEFSAVACHNGCSSEGFSVLLTTICTRSYFLHDYCINLHYSHVFFYFLRTYQYFRHGQEFF